MGIDPEQLDRWKRLVAGRASDPVRAHWASLHAAARSLLVLVEQQADEIARLEAELEVTARSAAPIVGVAPAGGRPMALRVHELHPILVHAPLVLLPAAAIVDVAAATSRSRVRRFALDRAGRRLWWVAVGSGIAAGLAGMAASQEIRLDDDAAKDAMWLHGMGNVGLLAAGGALGAWRRSHRATPLTAALGASAVGAALYTAWFGGELVYTHGAGVKGLPPGARAGVEESPHLLSASAPWRFVRDAFRGMAWLFGRGARLATRKAPLASGAVQGGATPMPQAGPTLAELRS